MRVYFLQFSPTERPMLFKEALQVVYLAPSSIKTRVASIMKKGNEKNFIDHTRVRLLVVLFKEVRRLLLLFPSALLLCRFPGLLLTFGCFTGGVGFLTFGGDRFLQAPL